MTERRPTTLQNRVTIHGIMVYATEIETDPEVFAAAVAAGRLDHEYDAYLSDMEGETLIVDPLGVVHRPYDDSPPDSPEFLINQLEPVLRHIPTWAIDQYAAQRRAEGK